MKFKKRKILVIVGVRACVAPLSRAGKREWHYSSDSSLRLDDAAMLSLLASCGGGLGLGSSGRKFPNNMMIIIIIILQRNDGVCCPRF